MTTKMSTTSKLRISRLRLRKMMMGKSTSSTVLSFGGDIYKIQDVFRHQTSDGNGRVLEQFVYIAEINDPSDTGRAVTRLTVLAYRGSQAREAQKSEFVKFSHNL
ncbi:hypothetical protein PM082_006362 [Marasmius tenuissimus]|nr:hypothetical protein PM082_006362 [Marasmius tenuissimus]